MFREKINHSSRPDIRTSSRASAVLSDGCSYTKHTTKDDDTRFSSYAAGII